MIDAIISLFILFLTLTSTYELFINTNRFKDTVIDRAELVHKESVEYEKSISDLFE